MISISRPQSSQLLHPKCWLTWLRVLRPSARLGAQPNLGLCICFSQERSNPAVFGLTQRAGWLFVGAIPKTLAITLNSGSAPTLSTSHPASSSFTLLATTTSTSLRAPTRSCHCSTRRSQARTTPDQSGSGFGILPQRRSTPRSQPVSLGQPVSLAPTRTEL